MARYAAKRIATMLDGCDSAPTADAAGERLESLVVYLFEKIPGIELYERNILDGPRAHELDLAFWHRQAKSPVYFLDPIVIVECKNTGVAVGSQGVGWFVRKLQDSGANVGILVALSGITGAATGNTSAHSEVLTALARDRIKILLLDRAEILSLRTTEDLVLLLREKYLALSLRRTVV